MCMKTLELKRLVILSTNRKLFGNYWMMNWIVWVIFQPRLLAPASQTWGFAAVLCLARQTEHVVVYCMSNLCSLLRQVEGNTLADFGRQLSEHFCLETTDHDPAQPLVQLVQVRCPTTVPLPATPEVPMREWMRSEAEVADAFLYWLLPRRKLTEKTYLFTEMPWRNS